MSTSAIQRVTAIPIRIPLPRERAWCPAFYHEPLNRGPTGGFDGPFIGDVPLWIIRVEGAAGGPVGWGDTVRGTSEEDMRRNMGLYLGRTLDEIDPRRQIADDRRLNGLHTAAMDWRTRCEGIPLWQLIGPRVRDRVRVEYWNAFRTPQGAAQVAREAAGRGFHGMKLKGSLEIDAPGIAREVLAAVGPDFHLTIDPNGRWTPPEEAIERAKAIQAINPAVMLEDPVYTGVEFYIRLRAEVGIPVARTVPQIESTRQVLAAGAVDALNVGGDWPHRLAASALAHEAGCPLWFGNSIETGIADLALIHLAATQPACTMGMDLAANMVREDDMLIRPIQYEDGFAVVPDQPGLGIDIDQDALERYRIGDPIVVG